MSQLAAPENIVARLAPLVPEDVRVQAAIPLPYFSEDQQKVIEFSEDDRHIRLIRGARCCDALIKASDLDWPDERLRQAILSPMLQAMERLEDGR